MIGYATMPQLTVIERWTEITGYGQDSAEWGEVLEALAEAGLLGADPLQHDLFADCDPLPDETERAWKVWLAVLGGAYLYRRTQDYHPATNTAIVAALLADFYTKAPAGSAVALPRDNADLALLMLRGDLPQRVVHVTDSPGDALKHLIDDLVRNGEGVRIPDVMAIVLDEAMADSALALRAFTRIARDMNLAITPLCQGQWLTYHSRIRH